MADEALVQDIVASLRASNFAGWQRMVAGYKNPDGSITLFQGAGANKVWVRPAEDSRGGTAVWGSAAYANMPLIVGPNIDGDFEVKTADQLLASISFGDGARVGTQPPGMSELVPDSIPTKALKAGRVNIASGLNVTVGAFAYPGGTWDSDALQDVSAEVPGTTGFVCWVKAYLDPDAETVGFESSTPVFGTRDDGSEAVVATILDGITLPAGAIPLGPAFTLVNGQTEASASRFAETDPRILLGAWDGVGVQSVVAGTNVTVDDTDPANPIVSATTGGSGNIYTSAYASPPGSPADGDWWLPSDGLGVVFARVSSAWVNRGLLFPLTQPSASGAAWDNQGSTTETDEKGALIYDVPANNSGNSLRVRYFTAPATPWTKTIALRFMHRATAATFVQAGGLCFRQSSDGKIATFGLEMTGAGVVAIQSRKWTNSTTFSADYVGASINAPLAMMFGGLVWLRITDDGTNRICQYSNDGQHWFTFHSVGRTDFLTADQFGWFGRADASASASLLMQVLSVA